MVVKMEDFFKPGKKLRVELKNGALITGRVQDRQDKLILIIDKFNEQRTFNLDEIKEAREIKTGAEKDGDADGQGN